MNISLLKPGPKRAAANGGAGGAGRRGGAANVFDDGSDGDSDAGDDAAAAGRAAVNRALAAEQAALRARAQRAAEAAIAADEANVYDYDGAVGANRAAASTTASDAASGGAAPDKGSRYMRDLLAASQARRLQRELVQERRVAREQEQEAQEAGADLRDKPAFVTASYKRRLQEREVWLAEEGERERRDGTVETKGMAGFYGNLNQNVALGHAGAEEETRVASKDESIATDQPGRETGGLGFLEGFEKATDEPGHETREHQADTEVTTVEPLSKEPDAAEKNRIKRQLIEQKIAAARLRYFKRHNMEPEQ